MILSTKYYSFVSSRSNISEIEKILNYYNLDKCVEEEKYINFLIASSEALLNAIVHGNKENSEKKVELRIVDESNKFTLSIKDEGNGFNLEKIPDPTKDENLFKENGRGLFIIKSLVDSFECISGKEGTEIIISVNKKGD